MTTAREQRAVGEFRCPTCDKPKGEVCVYVGKQPTPHKYWQTDANRARQAAADARVGTPTKHPHMTRLDKVNQAEMQERKAARDRIIFKRPSPGVVAYREEQTAEYFEMQAWLRQHHGLLFTIKR